MTWESGISPIPHQLTNLGNLSNSAAVYSDPNHHDDGRWIWGYAGGFFSFACTPTSIKTKNNSGQDKKDKKNKKKEGGILTNRKKKHGNRVITTE